MLENFIIAIILNSSECKVNQVQVITPYGDMCLTKEQSKTLKK